jgi:hypothetical protein
MHQLINREVASDRGQQALDRRLVAVYIKKPANDLRSSDRVDTLCIDLNKLGEPVLIQIEDEVVNKVKTVANNDKGQLIGKFRPLEEVLDCLRITIVAFATDSLNFTDLASASGGLDVLETDLRILAEVYDGAKIVIQSYTESLSTN